MLFRSKSSSGTVVYNTIAEYTESNYDTSSFDTEIWRIDTETNVPEIKKK